MRCQKCGAENASDCKFCTSCGAKLEEQVQEERSTRSVINSWIFVQLSYSVIGGVMMGMMTAGGAFPLASAFYSIIVIGLGIYTAVICKKYARPSFAITVINGAWWLVMQLLSYLAPASISIYLQMFAGPPSLLTVIIGILMIAGGLAALYGRREAWIVLLVRIAITVAWVGFDLVSIVPYVPGLLDKLIIILFNIVIAASGVVPLIFTVLNAKNIQTSPVVHAAAQPICPSCGAPLSQGDAFCVYCGAKVRP